MASLRKRLLTFLRPYRSLTLIVAAAVLLELIAAVQFYYTRQMMEEELEEDVLSELIIKALRTREILSNAQTCLQNNLWYVERYIDEPDTVAAAVHRIVTLNTNHLGAFAAFQPYYYPSKGQYYEPYALQEGAEVQLRQIGSDFHDYTQREFYKAGIRGDTVTWQSPYWDGEGAGAYTSSYVLPIRNNKGTPVGVLGIDLSLEWIGSMLNARHLYPSSFDLFLTPEGQLVTGPNTDSISTEKIGQIVRLINDSTVERWQTKDKRCTALTFYDEERDERAYVYYANMIVKPHWQVAVVCYDSEVFGDLYRMHRNVGLLLLCGVFVLGFIVTRFARNERRLHKADMEQQRIASELHIASEIQTGMLPSASDVSLSERKEIAVCGTQVPAKEVGGDLYDFFIRDEKLFFCIGDVSGKGVPAALVMAVVHSQFRMASVHENNPARILQVINATACEGNDSCMFVTFFVGVLDLPTGRLRYCNAGHECPVLLGDDISQLPAEAHTPIGLFADCHYEVQETVLLPDTMLFLYTDGLTEARNRERKQLGRERVLRQLAPCRQMPPEQVLQQMKDEVASFAEGAEQSDDLTMLAIRYTPIAESDILHQTLTLQNDVSQVAQLGEFVKAITTQLAIPSQTARSLRLAVEEAVVNVMSYAYPSGTVGDIIVTAKADARHLKFVITDNGAAFDPTEAAAADTSLPVEDRPIGGLGILLVRQYMDSINYERIDGKNILTLKKKL